ncbi:MULTISPECIES: prepilin-type N-terminal cleavage/methylation domain-containing protein [Campylobacter]|uniref:prepilin-type N-terminal cleavage/methylation domain-containing protein n=1 Tax=Campylobacter TaxID=194 RepID=UPI0014707506|nr:MULTISPECIES: prepilin-type N-terminal cleavage/methylation domain-containing protein [Campylobacter]MBN7287661.1 prepilin-type N-terminal cleavage/methylation domain-containing protein [Campylobacter curvus]MDU6826468.1 prepilin-type N-terminal cleavage/methylation domain-containing protein [Campylobacter sp.]
MRKAFTLVELILVIVILGIIALMTLDMLFNVYKNYSQSKVISSLETQTELVLEQISKRLGYRIKESVIARKPDNTYLALNDERVNFDYTVLEFITYSYEAFDAGIYSGLADLSVSSAVNGLVSPGSKFDVYSKVDGSDQTARQMFIDLTDGKVDFKKDNGGVAVVFKGIAYDVEKSFGYQKKINNGDLDVARASVKDGTTLNISNYDGKRVSEQYHLAYTAYAISTGENSAQGDFDLILHYNYRPWMGEKYDSQNTPKATLASHVTRFNFIEQNGVIALKLCIKAENSEATICKTKAIY